MIMHLLAVVLAMFVPQDAVDRLKVEAVLDGHRLLDDEGAREHIAAAAAASIFSGADPAVLLVIARRESGFQAGVRYRERSGGLSCGVIQARADTEADCTRLRTSLVYGYYKGGLVLRAWRAHPRCRGNLTCGLIGYGGGAPLLDLCRANPRSRGCVVAAQRAARARRIRDQSPES